MTALLGLLAIAGYQNRDKLFKMLGDLGKPGAAGPDGIGGLLGQLRKNFGETSPGRVLTDGLGELVDRFKQSGYGDTAESWVGTGPNKSMTPAQFEQAIGPEVLDSLAKQTGLSKDDLLSRRLARFQTPSTATPRKADSRLTKGSFDFSKRAVRNERTHPDAQRAYMSALGHKRTFCTAIGMSALPPKEDMCSATRDVRVVPIADIPRSLDQLVFGPEANIPCSTQHT